MSWLLTLYSAWRTWTASLLVIALGLLFGGIEVLLSLTLRVYDLSVFYLKQSNVARDRTKGALNGLLALSGLSLQSYSVSVSYHLTLNFGDETVESLVSVRVSKNLLPFPSLTVWRFYLFANRLAWGFLFIHGTK